MKRFIQSTLILIILSVSICTNLKKEVKDDFMIIDGSETAVLSLYTILDGIKKASGCKIKDSLKSIFNKIKSESFRYYDDGFIKINSDEKLYLHNLSYELATISFFEIHDYLIECNSKLLSGISYKFEKSVNKIGSLFSSNHIDEVSFRIGEIMVDIVKFANKQ